MGALGVLGQPSFVSTPYLALYLRIGLLSQVDLTQAFFLLVGAKLHSGAGSVANCACALCTSSESFFGAARKTEWRVNIEPGTYFAPEA